MHIALRIILLCQWWNFVLLTNALYLQHSWGQERPEYHFFAPIVILLVKKDVNVKSQCEILSLASGEKPYILI